MFFCGIPKPAKLGIYYDVVSKNLKKFSFVLLFLEIIALLGLKSPFSVVSVYAKSSFFYIKKIKIENCSIFVHIYPLNSIFQFDFD